LTDIVLAGDWHADATHAVRVIEAAASIGATRVVQTGDFGFWPQHPRGRDFITKVAARCVELGLSVWFCDGNHEDHSQLPHASADQPVSVAPSVWWVPRGTVVEWDGRRVMFMGGAVSVDQPRRTPGIDWFPTEIPTPAEVARAVGAGPVDIVAAHEGLPGTPLVSTYRSFIPPEIVELADRVRSQMGDIADAVSPDLWVHGHWHHRMSAVRGSTRVECLHESRGPFEETMMVCSLDTLETRTI
jgi:hypothetical protein